MGMRAAPGFTLLEVLVTLLVIAVGIVGAAGAQLVGARTRHQSALHSQAVQLAASLAERMRANRAQLDLPDGANLYSAFTYDAAGAGPPAAVPCYGQASCDSARMAAFDLADVSAFLHSQFPAGRVAICRDATAWDDARRHLSWACASGAHAPLVIKIGYREHDGDGAQAQDGEVLPVVALVVGDGA